MPKFSPSTTDGHSEQTFLVLFIGSIGMFEVNHEPYLAAFKSNNPNCVVEAKAFQDVSHIEADVYDAVILCGIGQNGMNIPFLKHNKLKVSLLDYVFEHSGLVLLVHSEGIMANRVFQWFSLEWECKSYAREVFGFNSYSFLKPEHALMPRLPHSSYSIKSIGLHLVPRHQSVFASGGIEAADVTQSGVAVASAMYGSGLVAFFGDVNSQRETLDSQMWLLRYWREVNRLPVSERRLKCALCASRLAGVGSTGLSKCGRCKAVHYCSRTCQVAHWETHRPKCTLQPTNAE